MGQCPHFKKCCPVVWDKRGEPMTNEEWFTSMSTEEKAEFAMRVFKICAWCLDGGSPNECPFNEFLHCPAESKENMVKWLKEIHDE